MGFSTLVRIVLAAAATVALQAASPIAGLTPGEVPKTAVTNAAALQKLVANTGVTLQWNWNTAPGKLVASVRDGALALKGEQVAADGGRLEIDGVVTRLDERIFTFRGRIFIHDAEAGVDCLRDGDYTFRITGARKYWRMKEQEAHCDGRADLTDYVDIRF